MPLTRRVRAFVVLTKVLAAVRLFPDARRVAAMPVAKRLAVVPPRWALDPDPGGLVETDHALPHGPRLRLYRPEGEASPPVLLYLHGGGFAVGGLAGSDHICRRLAADSRCAVVAVEYRLAPEHPYPAALDDAEAALQWVLAESARLGLDSTRLAVGGDSAGGNLAAALVQRVHAATPLRAQLLIYPALDATRSTPSAQHYDGPGLSVEDLIVCWDLYCAGRSPEEPGISPLLAPDVAGLPPALVVTAGYDSIRDEALRYAERLTAGGVACTAVDYPDYLHGFLSVPRLYGGVDEAWALLSSFLAGHLETAPTWTTT